MSKNQILGVAISSYSGSGIYYLKPISNNSNIAFTGGYWYTYEKRAREHFYSFGIEYQHDLTKTKVTRVYIDPGFSVNGNNYIHNSSKYYNKKNTIVAYGAGFGAELYSEDLSIVYGFKVGYQLRFSNRLTYAGLGLGMSLGYTF